MSSCRNFNYPYISKQHHRVLAAVAHLPVHLVPGVPVYPPGGQPGAPSPGWMFNLFVVWAATGIWHGASWNYLIWGLYFFVLLMVEKFFLLDPAEKGPALVQHVYTLFFVLVQLGYLCRSRTSHRMGGLSWRRAWSAAGLLLGSTPGLLSLLPAHAVRRPLWPPLRWRADVGAASLRTGGKMVLPVLLLGGLFVCTAYLVDGTYNPFLYFRF